MCMLSWIAVNQNIYSFYTVSSKARDENGYQFIPTQRGKHLLMIDGFTYSQMKLSNNYYCSKKQSANCRARVKLDGNGRIVRADYTHKHPPPTYVQTSTGQFYKL